MKLASRECNCMIQMHSGLQSLASIEPGPFLVISVYVPFQLRSCFHACQLLGIIGGGGGGGGGLECRPHFQKMVG